ncbi:ATP-binding cassette domain-containing protein [Gemmatimonadota bacterium]
MNENLLELHDVTVAYHGRTVLSVPHLAVRRGEILTLLGENGSGKTTLLRLLGLLVRPHEGRVVLGGEEVDFGSARRLLELRRRMAGVMQEPLLCRMSVRRNVALGLRFRRLPKPETERRVDAWLQRLSISHLGDRQASNLSGGEAQRTSLARAMVLDPEALFLDEPFAALDAPTRQGLLQEFKAVLADSGVTTVFATHDRGEALGLGGSGGGADPRGGGTGRLGGKGIHASPARRGRPLRRDRDADPRPRHRQGQRLGPG